VENRDLWERLLALLSLHKVTFHKVAGRSADKLNERADKLARLGIAGGEEERLTGHEITQN